MTQHLAILGAGNMAEAIARGVLRSNLLRAEQMTASDPSPQRRSLFTSELKIRVTENNVDAVTDADTVLLSVKPQNMGDVLGGLSAALRPDALIVSIAAGISTTFIERHLWAGNTWRVIRVMPNTPMLVGEGMAALAHGAHATEADVASARRLFEPAADVIEVPEDQIDA